MAWIRQKSHELERDDGTAVSKQRAERKIWMEWSKWLGYQEKMKWE